MGQSALASVQCVEGLASATSSSGTLSRCWAVDAVLATSGETEVYAATHTRGHRGALKVWAAPLDDETCQERFLRELALTDEASVVGSPSVLGYGVTEGGRPYLALELLAGLTLAEHSAVRRRFDVATALLLTERLLEVTEQLHALGIVHRDIHPTNVFITSFADVRLLDFSAAARIGVYQLGAPVRGVAGFAPPEQLRSVGDPSDPRVDVFAIGAVLYWMLCGSAQKLSRWAEGTTSEMPIDDIAHLPGDVIDFLELALAREPPRRLGSARVMRVVLSSIRAAVSGLDRDCTVT